MPTNIRGLEQVIANLNKMRDQFKQNSLKALIRAQIPVRRDMDKVPPKIPVDLGNLRASYFVVTGKAGVHGGKNVTGASPSFKAKVGERVSRGHPAVMEETKTLATSKGYPTIGFGFSAYYAWYVHEMVDAGGPYGTFLPERTIHWTRPGSGPKYFQAALNNNKGKMLKIIEENLRKTVAGRKKP